MITNLTTTGGNPIADNQNSLSAGPRGACCCRTITRNRWGFSASLLGLLFQIISKIRHPFQPTPQSSFSS